MERFSPQDVPNSPGVYVFRNSAGDVIYVGKARSLRKRLSGYFQPSKSKRADPKLRALINSIHAYETIAVRSEAEALLLESRLIKEYHPRYNVELRDDKRFLHICVDPAETYPRLVLVRIRKDDNRIYWGPFPVAGVLRGTVDFLSKRFRLRTCKTDNPTPETCRHCMEHRIKQCSCPCIGKISAEEYRASVDRVFDVLNGNTREVEAELEARMKALAADMRFEDAARVRDMLTNIRTVCVGGRRTFRRATLPDGDPTAGREAVKALAAALGLPRPPRRIECFDMSNIRGTLAVGSMVCFRDGRPAKSDYRRYRIRSETAADDTAMMKEVVSRRYTAVLRAGGTMPDLIVVDGGKGQLHRAIEALRDAGVPPVPILGLAKKQEEIFLPGRSDPIVLERADAALKLLQAIRDEAHRFAIGYHRDLRRKRIRDSMLSEVPGVGEKRRAELLRALGSVQSIAAADVADIAAAVPGLGPVLAKRIRDYLVDRLRRPGDRSDPVDPNA